MTRQQERNVCIFCGGNFGNDPIYVESARQLARSLVDQGWGIVYGGASVGIMGVIADTALEAGGRVTGVIPQALFEREVAHHGLTELHRVTTMHERKKMMYDLSDAFITFPGGFGTLDETFEILTWKQIGLHKKPLICFDLNGFFTPLLTFVDQAAERGFIKPEHRALFSVAKDMDSLLKLLSTR
ncbi:MAG: TIGR00730 family Rossman fold protein [Bdellovibrionota bacterium]